MLLAEAFKKKNYKIVIRTSKRQANHLCKNIIISNSFIKALKKGIKCEKGDLIISHGSPWIFPKSFLDRHKGNIYNIHNRPLPKHRGAGGFSWQILMNEKESALCMHRISNQIDAGTIVFFKKYFLPLSAKYPWEYEQLENETFKKLLNKIVNCLLQKKQKQKKQINKNSFYWPRLYAPLNAWIDWNWSLKSILLFIRAFASPYDGAKTFLKGTPFYIYDADIIKTKNKFHPFQKGLIFRKLKNQIYIAHPDGILKIKHFRCVKIPFLGDRLYTNAEIIEESLSRFKILPSGQTTKI